MVDLVIYFFIYSVLGVLLETVYVYIVDGCYSVRRSMLSSPMCVVYGVGALSLIVSHTDESANSAYCFVSGAAACSAVEYGLSLLYERLCGVLLWDYSHRRFNLNGRVCALYSLMWGGVSVLFCLYLHPAVKFVVSGIDFKTKTLSAVIMLIFFRRDLRQTLAEMRKKGRGEKSVCDTALEYVTRAPDRKIF